MRRMWLEQSWFQRIAVATVEMNGWLSTVVSIAAELS